MLLARALQSLFRQINPMRSNSASVWPSGKLSAQRELKPTLYVKLCKCVALGEAACVL